MPFWVVRAQLFRFAFVGLCTNLIDVASFSAFVFLFGVAPLTANGMSYPLAAGFSFISNRVWTFGQPLEDGGVRKQALRFAAVNSGGIVMSSVLVATLSPHAGALLAKLATTAILFGYFFFMSRRVVFTSSAA